MSDYPYMNKDEKDTAPVHYLDDVVHDILSETFCEDCEHPRCTRKVESYTQVIQSLINSEVLAVLNRLEVERMYSDDGGFIEGVPTEAIEAEKSKYGKE